MRRALPLPRSGRLTGAPPDGRGAKFRAPKLSSIGYGAPVNFGPFIEKWSASSGAERANKDLFFAELCDVLGIERPNPVTGDPEADTYVFEAYGWSDLGEVLVGRPGATTPLVDKPDDQAEAEEELLRRLVTLNAERAAEEARGHVRWLRPEFQAPGAIQTSVELGSSDDEEDAADEAPDAVRKQAWPKALPDQLSAARGEIKTLPQPFRAAELAARFTGAKIEDVEAALDCLAALGLVLHVEAPDGAPAFAAVDAGVVRNAAA